MIAARTPVQRRRDARLLVIDDRCTIAYAARADLADFLEAGDLVIANDAATLPASLHGIHSSTGAAVELEIDGVAVKIGRGADAGVIAAVIEALKATR